MTEQEFWQHLGTINRKALQHGDEETAVAPLVERLSRLEEAEIYQFEECLAHALYRLDGAKYARHAGDSGQSSDGFLYARCFVVGLGKEQYEQVLDDPAKMSQFSDAWFESLLYIAEEAWARVTGRAAEEWEYETSVSYETGSNEDGWQDDVL